MFENYRKFETMLSGRKLVVETGKMSRLANGSCLVRYGDTVVHVAVTASKAPREGIDFFPLSVDFEERLYSVGKIPGSFSKREGKPSEKAILASRVIDRPIRPLFPKDMRNDVAVVCTVMSVDEDCSPEISAIIGTSVALSISDIPWDGPIGAVNVGYVGGKFVINPTLNQKKNSKLSLTVASTNGLISMIEAGADIVSDDIMFDAIIFGHNANQEIIKFIENIKSQVGKEKFEYISNKLDENLYSIIGKLATDKIKSALKYKDNLERNKKIDEVVAFLREQIAVELENFEKTYNIDGINISEYVYKIQKEIVRNWILEENYRVDGRKIDEIRPLSAEIGLLPRVHGSGMFNRGLTQVLTSVTLGPISEQQSLDGIDSEVSKRYMHHYNFPSFSVGETRPSRGPGRREIGHGALAERALLPVIPSEDEFPYTIRLVSEVLSSNGSTSQGSVCGSTLALMDAGVPIKAAVAGISCGLVTKDDKWVTMVDIQGIEDFFGDMDFKVAGTKEGITAIQMDIKIKGLSPEIVKNALEKTHIARNYILDEIIFKTISSPKKSLSKYAPKVEMLKIPVDKIRDVIGAGGKIVQKICSDYEVTVDINDDGKIFITGMDKNRCQQALEFIKNLTKDLAIGEVYNGVVTKITDFGAFIEILPGKEGLCHISNISHRRINKVSDVLKNGQEVRVRLMEIDRNDKINLSIRDV